MEADLIKCAFGAITTFASGLTIGYRIGVRTQPTRDMKCYKRKQCISMRSLQVALLLVATKKEPPAYLTKLSVISLLSVIRSVCSYINTYC